MDTTSASPVAVAANVFLHIGEELDYIRGPIDRARSRAWRHLKEGRDTAAVDFETLDRIEKALCPVNRLARALCGVVPNMSDAQFGRALGILADGINPVARLHRAEYARETTRSATGFLFRNDPAKSAKRAELVLHLSGAPPFPTLVQARTLLRVVAKEIYPDSPRKQDRLVAVVEKSMLSNPVAHRELRHRGDLPPHRHYDFEMKHPTLAGLTMPSSFSGLPAEIQERARAGVEDHLHRLLKVPPSPVHLVAALGRQGIGANLGHDEKRWLQAAFAAALAPRSPEQVDAIASAIRAEAVPPGYAVIAPAPIYSPPAAPLQAWPTRDVESHAHSGSPASEPPTYGEVIRGIPAETVLPDEWLPTYAEATAGVTAPAHPPGS